MYRLTLYHCADPATPLGDRTIGDEAVIVGRDLSADWVLDDPERRISRRHLELRSAAGVLAVRVLGGNGVYTGEPRKWLKQGDEAWLTSGDSVEIGSYRLLIEECVSAGTPAEVRTTASLLDAFCEGAELDPSNFLADDPIALMREAGAIYRQMLLSLKQLLAHRGSLRNDLGVDRTTISARENNLLKWAPVQRAAIDLLKREDSAFLTGADAVSASFDDVEQHLVAMMEGHRAAVLGLLDAIRPARLTNDTPKRLLRDPGAAAWERYVTMFSEIEQQLAEERDGVIQQGFADGYDRSNQRMAGRRP